MKLMVTMTINEARPRRRVMTSGESCSFRENRKSTRIYRAGWSIVNLQRHTRSLRLSRRVVIKRSHSGFANRIVVYVSAARPISRLRIGAVSRAFIEDNYSESFVVLVDRRRLLCWSGSDQTGAVQTHTS